MAKAYMVVTYRSLSDPKALEAYAKLAGPAVQAAGGRFLVRGMPAMTYEMGMNQRTVVVEFDSLEQARAATCALSRAWPEPLLNAPCRSRAAP
jgi:uncharacterized protein (DUF1330 family)